MHAFSSRPPHKDKWMRDRDIQEMCSASMKLRSAHRTDRSQNGADQESLGR